MKNTIAYCGLDFKKCNAYLATINNDQALRERTARLWSKLNSVSILSDTSTVKGAVQTGENCILRAAMRHSSMCHEKASGSMW